MVFRICIVCMAFFKLACESCSSEECNIKAALVINLLKFLSNGGNLNFCVNPTSPLKDLFKIGFEKQADDLSKVKLVWKERFDSSCNMVFLERKEETPLSAFIISDGLEVEHYNLKIFLVGNKFRFTVNLRKETSVKMDPRLINLAYEVVR